MTDTLTKQELVQFVGDVERFRHSLNPRVIYTPGVQHVAEAGGAYWLIDAIASYLTPRYLEAAIASDPRVGELQFWRLTVSEERSAVLEARVDSDCESFVRQGIPFTDFPLESVDIWAGFDGEVWTLYLPSEH